MIASQTKTSRTSTLARTRPLVLVIDDEADLCRVLRLKLQGEGYDVETANDGVEGLSKARALHPSIILLDIVMPRLNGYQMLAQLQQDTALANTPILVISIVDEAGKHSPDEWTTRLGVRGYLPKPFDPEAVVAKIRNILGEAGGAS